MDQNDEVAKEVTYILNTAFKLLEDCEKCLANKYHDDIEAQDLIANIITYRKRVLILFNKHRD